jgi:outer membrane protein assembly factor BamD (BamD/ComL family)
MKIRIPTAVLLLLLAACATTGGGGKTSSSRYYQADHKQATPAEIDEEVLRQKVQDARNYQSRGQQAQQSGNMDQARAEWTTAGEQFAKLAETFPTSEWRIVFRYTASQTFFFAQKYQDCASNALRILGDPEANDASKAIAAHLAFSGWQQQALADARAGKLEPLKFPEQRKDKPLAARSPPGAWKQVVESADAYVKYASADPDLKKPPGERFIAQGPAQVALFAAQVEYAFDNLEDARARSEHIMKTWPSDGEVLDDAVSLYLNTFLIQNDQTGYRAALEQVGSTVLPKLEQSQDPQAKATAAKMKAQIAKYRVNNEFGDAKALLDQGKSTEAAQAFEQVAAKSSDEEDASSALYNAALAWNKAGDSAKAGADVSAILEKYPASKIVSRALLLGAQLKSKAKDHPAATKMYGQFLEKYGDGPNRCLALQNLAYEAAEMGKKVDAAQRYLDFGKDERCRKEDPNSVVKALYVSAKFFTDAKQKAKAREAFEATASVEGVTDVVAKSQVEDAKQKLKGK